MTLTSISREQVASAYRDACALELAALKPGNVHFGSPGHGMSVADFLLSAEASAGPLTEPGLGLGERILGAVTATRAAVGCNTNLGILLLCGPLIQAALAPDPRGTLRDRLERVLGACDCRDTDGLFAAIRLAAPAGLGASAEHDVGATASAAPLEVMACAAERDLIARQYVTGFADLFGRGLRQLAAFDRRWSDPVWSTAALFMDFLARFPDSHVARKQGLDTARAVRARAAPITAELHRARRPESCLAELRRFDRALKEQGINPGTCADLTVACLLIRRLDPLCRAREPAAARHPLSRSLDGVYAAGVCLESHTPQRRRHHDGCHQ